MQTVTCLRPREELRSISLVGRPLELNRGSRICAPSHRWRRRPSVSAPLHSDYGCVELRCSTSRLGSALALRASALPFRCHPRGLCPRSGVSLALPLAAPQTVPLCPRVARLGSALSLPPLGPLPSLGCVLGSASCRSAHWAALPRAGASDLVEVDTDDGGLRDRRTGLPRGPNRQHIRHHNLSATE